MEDNKKSINTNNKETIGKVIKVDDLKGYEVQNLEGEKLGELDDILIDYNNGLVAYGILSVGGFLGIGDDIYAIPWKAFKVNAPEKYLSLDLDKKKLEDAPSFNREKWPDMDKRKWHTDIHTYYAMQPYWNYAGGHMVDPDTGTPDRPVSPRKNQTRL